MKSKIIINKFQKTLTLISEEKIIGTYSIRKSFKRPSWHTNLGSEIMIHGQPNIGLSKQTIGCIMVENNVLDILWGKCNLGTKVNILP